MSVSHYRWNSFLTRSLRAVLGTNLWVIALVHGYWDQRQLSGDERQHAMGSAHTVYMDAVLIHCCAQVYLPDTVCVTPVARHARTMSGG
jgi:hypothetical protein